MKISVSKIEKAILRKKVTTRGGGVEIDLEPFGFPGHKMAAYQNYLGGGMLGAVQSNDTIRHAGNVDAELHYSSEVDKLDKIAEALRRYFHNLTNPDSEWEGSSFEDNQSRPTSAY